jgi:hypothetical protein
MVADLALYPLYGRRVCSHAIRGVLCESAVMTKEMNLLTGVPRRNCYSRMCCDTGGTVECHLTRVFVNKITRFGRKYLFKHDKVVCDFR